MSKNIQHSITVKNKKHVYTLVPSGKNMTRINCITAGVNQDFLNEDVPALLSDLPNLIIAEQEYSQSQSTVVHFRLKMKEKVRLEHDAIKYGFSNVSAYLRDVAFAR